jgi:copper chaperone NosL
MKAIFYLGFVILFVGCDISVVPINYNQDECSSCKMLISDKRFGAELVTSKGKVFKYDAIECMMRELAEKGKEGYKIIVVNHYDQPGNLFDAATSMYLISKSLPSPMGGYLSAYQNKESALAILDDQEGVMFSFDELLEHYKDD